MKKEFYMVSTYAEAAYKLISNGINSFKTAEEQCQFLDSLVCQCAIFTKILNGEAAFQSLLERLSQVEIDVDEIMTSISVH